MFRAYAGFRLQGGNELPDVLARLRGSTGASGGGYQEWQVNLDIANRAARMLRAITWAQVSMSFFV